MTTQPKLPEWAEEFIRERTVHNVPPFGESMLKLKDGRTLASRLMAEIVPEGHVVIPKKHLADLRHLAAYVGLAAINTPLVPVYQIMADAMRDIPETSNPGPAAEPCKYCNEVHKDSRLACAAEYRAKQADPDYEAPVHRNAGVGRGVRSPKQAEGGGKCKCVLKGGADAPICSAFTAGPRHPHLCGTGMADGTLCTHRSVCHEGARP